MKNLNPKILLFLLLATLTMSAQNNTDEDYSQIKSVNNLKSNSNTTSPPEFPGGNKELVNYLTKNIKYPKNSRSASSRGKVIVCFTIEKDGKITNTQIVKGINKILNKEALRVVAAMPNWKPELENGVAIRSKRNMPIIFFRN
jgi:TonB family protein